MPELDDLLQGEYFAGKQCDDGVVIGPLVPKVITIETLEGLEGKPAETLPVMQFANHDQKLILRKKNLEVLKALGLKATEDLTPLPPVELYGVETNFGMSARLRKSSEYDSTDEVPF